LKIARTIADFEGAEALAPPHVREAIQYRNLDRRIAMVPGEVRRAAAGE
jgi:magnesium chelatase family protein